jgi:aminopeptidase 2
MLGLANDTRLNSVLVWDSMLNGIGTSASTWWENQQIVDGLRAFQRELVVPLIARLGYEYGDDESADTVQLRTRAVQAAIGSRDERFAHTLTHVFLAADVHHLASATAKLKSWFATYLETGSDSHIPPDLLATTYGVAVRTGGRREFDAIKQIHAKPRNPAQGIAAMRSLGASEDPALAQETLEYAMEHARDQDLVYFVSSITNNMKTRRVATNFFKDNYERLYKRFEGNFSLKFIVEVRYVYVGGDVLI